MKIHTDEHLHFYSDRYMRENFADHGITLEQYLDNPHRYRRIKNVPKPIVDMLDTKEKMKHHRYKRNGLKSLFFPKPKKEVSL